MRQITFACQPSFEKYARPSRREQFLNTMETVIPWSELEALIGPYYPKAGDGGHQGQTKVVHRAAPKRRT